MKLTWLKLLCAVTLLTAAAQAQLAVYGKLDLTHYNDSSSNTSIWFRGGGVGIYDDFIHLGPVRAGLDLRGDLGSGDEYQYHSALVGVRVAVKAPILPFKPYVQASVGAGGSKYTGATAPDITPRFSGKLLWELLGGLDWTVFPHVDFRVIEVGFGKQSSETGANYASGPTLVLVSSGLVFRFR